MRKSGLDKVAILTIPAPQQQQNLQNSKRSQNSETTGKREQHSKSELKLANGSDSTSTSRYVNWLCHLLSYVSRCIENWNWNFYQFSQEFTINLSCWSSDEDDDSGSHPLLAKKLRLSVNSNQLQSSTTEGAHPSGEAAGTEGASVLGRSGGDGGQPALVFNHDQPREGFRLTTQAAQQCGLTSFFSNVSTRDLGP